MTPRESCPDGKPPIRLLACDLDGTLLGPGDTGLETAKSVVEHCRSRGVAFTIATGRVFGAVEKYLRYLDLRTPVVTNGGAMVAALDGESLMERVIGPDTAELVALELRARGLPFYFIAGKDMVTEWTGPETAYYSASISFDIRVVPSVTDLRIAPTQIVVRVAPEQAPDLAAEFRSRWPQVTVLLSLPHLIEFQAGGVSKASALAYLAGTLGITKEEVLAVGDSLNDLDMLAWAGRSACVGNAHPEVTRRVDAVAEGLFSEGVLEIAKKLI